MSLLETPQAGAYAAIIADPPWGFLTYGKHRTTPHRTAVDHYKTMTAAELQALPVNAAAAKDCALFMWTVDSHLEEAMHLGRAWGFGFKTIAFIWCKSTRGSMQLGLFPRPSTHGISMGYWTRKQAETCLLFTKGKPKRLSKGVRQIIEEPRREHSRKPDAQYSRVEALVAGPYLEMFARQAAPGWDAWGNQVGKFEAAK